MGGMGIPDVAGRDLMTERMDELVQLRLREVLDDFYERIDSSIESELRAAIDAYLVDLPSSSWGQFFSIHDEEGRERAVDYIYRVILGTVEKL